MNKHFVIALIGVLLAAGIPLAAVTPYAAAAKDDNGHKDGHGVNDNSKPGPDKGQQGSTPVAVSSNQGDNQPTADSVQQVGTAAIQAKGLAIVGKEASAQLQQVTMSLQGIIYNNREDHRVSYSGTISVGSAVYQVVAKGSLNMHPGHHINLLTLNGKASGGSNNALALRFIVIKDANGVMTVIGEPAGRIGLHTKLYAVVGSLSLSTITPPPTGPGALDHFQVSTIGNQVAGQSFSFTISAVANDGNIKTDYNGTTTLNTNEAQSPLGNQTLFSPLSYTFTSSDQGVHTFSAKMYDSMQGVYVNVTGSGKAGMSNRFTVMPSQAATVTVAPSSVTLAPNGNTTFNARAFDPYANPIPSQTFLWSLSTGSIGTLGAGINASSRTVVAPSTNTGANGTVVATAQGTTATGSAKVSITATAIFLDHFAISHIANQTAGHQFDFIVTAIDNLGHTMTGFDGRVNMTTTDAASPLGNSSKISPVSYIFLASDAGQHIFTAKMFKAANGITITASGWGKTGTSNAFNVTHAVISRVNVTPDNITLSANATITVSANATDAYGNPISKNFVWTLPSELGTITPAGDTQSALLKAANVHVRTTGMMTVTAAGTSVSTEVPVAVNV